MAILGIALTPMLMLQETVYRGVVKRSRAQAQIYRVLSFLQHARLELKKDPKQATVKEQLANPALTLSYTRTEPREKSPLGEFKHIKIEKVAYNWQEQGRRFTDRMVALIYQPPAKKENNRE